MPTPHPLDILFLTNFSDYCFRSIPAIAQMADALKVRLTVMHVYDPKRSSQAEAEGQVQSFFPEADRYAACYRLAVRGPFVSAVKRHLELWPVNLIVAPSSDPIGLPRIGDRSMRARLLEECGIPIWTIGRRVKVPKLMQPVRNVACWLDFRSPETSHLSFAMDYAHKINARLHLLRAIPEIHEGSLLPAAHPGKALHPDLAAEEILRLCAGAPLIPEVHVSSGEGRTTLVRMLRECDADAVFVPNQESLLARWLRFGLQASARIECPAIYVGNHVSIPVWNLERGPGSLVKTAARTARETPRETIDLKSLVNGKRIVPVSRSSELK